MKSAYTRTGKRTLKGKFDDVKKAGQRAYIQNFKVRIENITQTPAINTTTQQHKHLTKDNQQSQSITTVNNQQSVNHKQHTPGDGYSGEIHGSKFTEGSGTDAFTFHVPMNIRFLVRVVNKCARKFS